MVLHHAVVTKQAVLASHYSCPCCHCLNACRGCVSSKVMHLVPFLQDTSPPAYAPPPAPGTCRVAVLCTSNRLSDSPFCRKWCVPITKHAATCSGCVVQARCTCALVVAERIHTRYPPPINAPHTHLSRNCVPHQQPLVRACPQQPP